jgi:hypothetical protein
MAGTTTSISTSLNSVVDDVTCYSQSVRMGAATPARPHAQFSEPTAKSNRQLPEPLTEDIDNGTMTDKSRRL